MKKKLTTASTGLPDCVLQKARELHRKGFRAICKTRCKLDGEDVAFRDERLPLEDQETLLFPGEQWGLVFHDGENHRKIVFPSLLDLEGRESQGKPGTGKSRHWLSSNSQGWVERQAAFFKAAGQQVTATFTTQEGEEITTTGNRKHLQKSDEWRNRDRTKGASLESLQSSLPAEMASDRLQGALDELSEAGEEITPAIWKALECAFRAGECAGQYEATGSRMEAARGRPMAENQNRKGTRREWTGAALAFMRKKLARGEKATGRDVAEFLRSKLIVDFDSWGDDIEFLEDGTTKTKARFEAALSDLRKKL